MRILCVLQNAWGDRRLPITFVPNPYNHSAKVIKKMVGSNYYEFSNTTDVVTPTSHAKPKPNYAHFKRVIERMKYFDLILVCGKQAQEVVENCQSEINAVGVPLLFIPHPASRNLTNVKINDIYNQVKEYENAKQKIN